MMKAIFKLYRFLTGSNTASGLFKTVMTPDGTGTLYPRLREPRPARWRVFKTPTPVKGGRVNGGGR